MVQCIGKQGTEQFDDLRIQKETEVTVGKKIKKKLVPQDLKMPQRTEKPGIDANIAEHRPLYLFGLNLETDWCCLCLPEK